MGNFFELMANDLHHERGAFEPNGGAVAIRFVNGDEGYTSIPDVVALSGLGQRFAVIQDTAVEGCSDWYFDKMLWRCLTEYVVGQSGQVTVLEQPRSQDETPIDEYLEAWERVDPQDQEPPWALLLRSGGRLTLAMVTEYWCLSGGPDPYHDSYTYSLFSQRDVSEEVLLAIRISSAASRWRVHEKVIRVPLHSSRSSQAARHFKWLISWFRLPG